MDYFHVLAKMLQDEGRGRDTILAHITPAEARLLKSRGGRGSVNPVTGLLEFDDGGGGGGGDGGGGDGGGDGSGGGEGGGEGGGGEGPGGDSSDNANSNSEASAQDAAGGNAGQGAGPTGAGAGSTGEQGPGPDNSYGGGGGGDGGGGDYYYLPGGGGGGGGSSAPAAPSFAASPGFLAQLAAARNIGVPQVSIASNYQGSYAPDLGRLMALGLLDAAPVMPAAAQAPMGFGGGGYLDGGMFGQSSLAPRSYAQPVSYAPSPGGGISYEELLRLQRGY